MILTSRLPRNSRKGETPAAGYREYSSGLTSFLGSEAGAAVSFESFESLESFSFVSLFLDSFSLLSTVDAVAVVLLSLDSVVASVGVTAALGSGFLGKGGGF